MNEALRSTILFFAIVACSLHTIMGQERLGSVGAELSARAEIVLVKDRLSPTYAAVVSDKATLRVWRFTDGFQIQNNYEIELNPIYKGFKSLGGVLIGKQLRAYVLRPDRIIASLVVDTDSGDYDMRERYALPPGEHLVQSFTVADRLWLLAAHENGSDVFVYRDTEDGTLEKKKLLLGGLGGKQGNFSLYRHLTSDGGALPLLSPDAENPLRVARFTLKLYASDGRVVFTLEQPSGTRLAFVDVESLEVSFDEIPYPKVADGGSAAGAQGTSFLAGDVLFQAAATQQEIALRMATYPSLETLKELRAKNTEDISFKNGALLTIQKNDKPELVKSTFLFLKKLDGTHELALTVDNSYDRTHLITLGLLPSERGTPSKRAKKVTVDGAVEKESRNAQQLLPPFQYQSAADYSFANRDIRGVSLMRYILDASSLQQIKGDVPAPLLDDIATYAAALRNARNFTVLNLGWGYVFGYYNVSTSAYNFVSFADEQ